MRNGASIMLTSSRSQRAALDVLLQLTAQLTDDRPLEDFLKAVTEATLDLLHADHASIRLLDTTRTALLSGARSGTGEDDRPMDFKRGEGVLGWVIEHGQPARIGNVEHDSRWVKAEGQAFHVRSIIAEPLWSSGEVIGVLSVTTPAEGAFSDEDQLLLRLLANC
jgi:GAF domain-containing protein